ncbi:MAG: hypothetical protein JST68_27465 [Bacteroidetes bacterium]|nr:hypothetical protein [Bacteroidota bacterium]
MGFRYPFLIIKKAFRNLYFLMFFNGFILASMFYFKMEASYENGLFSSIKTSIDAQIDTNDTPDSVLVKSMNVCYQLMNPRLSTFNTAATDLGPEASLFHSTAVDLMTTKGACGAYSQVLARIIGTYHYPVRIGQMKAYGYFGAHNVVEAFTGKHWVVLDPTFNQSFVRPDSRLASFADVQNDWAYYSKQVPRNYDFQYRYEEVRYTNWSKVPVLFPAIKGVLNLTMGTEKADGLCIRTIFMNTYAVYYYVLILLYIPIFLLTFRQIIKTKIFPSQDIPFTFRNLIKYMRPRLIGTNSYITR